ARNHVELPLEVQVVPQDLAEHLGGVRDVRRERHEIGYGIPRWRSRFAADDQLDFRRLLGSWCRGLWSLGAHGDDTTRRHESAQQSVDWLSLHLTLILKNHVNAESGIWILQRELR